MMKPDATKSWGERYSPLGKFLLGILAIASFSFGIWSWWTQARTERVKQFRETLGAMSTEEKLGRSETGALQFGTRLNVDTPGYARVKAAALNYASDLQLMDYVTLIQLADRNADGAFANVCESRILELASLSPDVWETQVAFATVGEHRYICEDVPEGKRYYGLALERTDQIPGSITYRNRAKALILRRWIVSLLDREGNITSAEEKLEQILTMSFGSVADNLQWKSNSLYVFADHVHYVDQRIPDILVASGDKPVSLKKNAGVNGTHVELVDPVWRIKRTIRIDR